MSRSSFGDAAHRQERRVDDAVEAGLAACNRDQVGAGDLDIAVDRSVAEQVDDRWVRSLIDVDRHATLPARPAVSRLANHDIAAVVGEGEDIASSTPGQRIVDRGGNPVPLPVTRCRLPLPVRQFAVIASTLKVPVLVTVIVLMPELRLMPVAVALLSATVVMAVPTPVGAVNVPPPEA